jgi:2-keto-3-deoxy-L-rhamnonate aldolase RhmA
MANLEFRKRLLEGKPLIGIITHFDSVDLVEIIGYTGYDYVLLDAEHGSLSDERLSTMIRAAHGVGLPAVVRPRDNHHKSILRVCDLGADGVMVPQIESAAEAREAVEAMRYAPLGNRGLHPGTPAARWGTIPLQQHIELQNGGICSLIQIETGAGVEHAEEIARVPGVDALIVGPSDLSQSLGLIGQPSHPDVEAATDRAFSAARQAGIRAGTVAGTGERVRNLTGRGSTIFIASVLGLLTNGLTQQASAMRAAAE